MDRTLTELDCSYRQGWLCFRWHCRRCGATVHEVKLLDDTTIEAMHEVERLEFGTIDALDHRCVRPCA